MGDAYVGSGGRPAAPSCAVPEACVSYRPTDAYLPGAYDDLTRIAAALLRQERAAHALAPADLVHDTYLRLVAHRTHWRDRTHFVSFAVTAMRRVLVEGARAAGAQKRGGGAPPLGLDEVAPEDLVAQDAVAGGEDAAAALAEALERLGRAALRPLRVVECRYFAGLSLEETAASLGVSATTVKGDWRLARGWLSGEVRRALAA
jgi:RNA polymerase sigma-70 factor (ECF subfamily)